MILTDSRHLAKEIQDRSDRDAIVGIDGWTGVGKTSLAKVLANATGGSTFDLDTALDKDRNCYVAALRIDEIRRGLAAGGLLFVSGICLRQVLALVEVRADAHVYVKRMATWGWADEDDLLAKIPEFAGSSGESLRQEMRRYHLKWKPHLRSTYEFHRQC